ncbi:hypothetical protein AMECASPLE_018603 [Ameca splendens]|uniref:Uncharacterized protein n=1 Tax=Ameca splendens TaxID=208324 RepID=A0ABV0XRN2_9TELE
MLSDIYIPFHKVICYPFFSYLCSSFPSFAFGGLRLCYICEICLQTNTASQNRICGRGVELGWQTATNSLWLYSGRKQKVCLCSFVYVSPLFTFVSSTSLLSVFPPQTVVNLDFMSLVEWYKVHILFG